jgi:hypothetical protein
VALVHPGFGRLWAHPFSSLALVTMETIRNPSMGQPLNHTSTLGPWGLVAVRILVITYSRGETLIDPDGCASDRSGSSDRGDRGGVHRSRFPY